MITTDQGTSRLSGLLLVGLFLENSETARCKSSKHQHLEALSGLPGSADHGLHQLVADHWAAKHPCDHCVRDLRFRSEPELHDGTWAFSEGELLI